MGRDEEHEFRTLRRAQSEAGRPERSVQEEAARRAAWTQACFTASGICLLRGVLWALAGAVPLGIAALLLEKLGVTLVFFGPLLLGLAYLGRSAWLALLAFTGRGHV